MFEFILSGIAGLSFAAPLLYEAFSTPRLPLQTGAPSLVDAIGTVLPTQGPEPGDCWVEVRGERWKARSAGTLEVGSRVRVEAVDGLSLRVRPEPPRDPGQPEPSVQTPVRPLRRWWLAGAVLWAAAIALALQTSGSVTGAVISGPIVALSIFIGLGELIGIE